MDVLNEVLSLNAQEFHRITSGETASNLLNEVLSLNAQESTKTPIPDKVLFPQ